MALDAWLPIGFSLPDGARVRAALFEGVDWQVVETQGGGRALVAADGLAKRWIDTGLVTGGELSQFAFGDKRLWSLSSSPSQTLHPVSDAVTPNDKAEAVAFAQALKATRAIDSESPLQDAVARAARAVVLIGRDAEVIAAAVAKSGVPLLRADSMQSAVALAAAQAAQGDAVLLSPACASFDMFKNYVHRGEVFRDAVKELTRV